MAIDRKRGIIETQQMDRNFINEIFNLAKVMEEVLEKGGTDWLARKILFTLFFEESTRTRLSFETAMIRLGGRVISTISPRFSSIAKGESFEHTIKVISGVQGTHLRLADILVIRHPKIGAAKIASKVSAIPVVNAGDGPSQHPTQALLDLYTLQKELGQIDGLRIAMVGDLKYGRTVRSLCYLLGKHKGIRIDFIAPEIVRIKDDIKTYLKKHKVRFTETDHLAAAAKNADVIYATRIQRERFNKNLSDYEKAKSQLVITNKILDLMKKHSILMHPMPIKRERVDQNDDDWTEIHPECDNHPKAKYFLQAGYGVPIRMAILHTLLSTK